MNKLFYIFAVAAFGIHAGIVANVVNNPTETLLLSSWDDEDDEDDGWVACKEHEEGKEESDKTDSLIAKCSNGKCTENVERLKQERAQQEQDCSQGNCAKV